MAEAAGLALGAVALASLFSTCVDLVETIELSRNYAFDYHLACTKLGLLHERLLRWGRVVGIDNANSESSALYWHRGDERNAIEHSLLGVRGLLDNTAHLADKYRITARPKRPRAAASTANTELGDGCNSTRATRWTALRKRTTWAIHDKAKLDALISDLDFLIKGLEEVARGFGPKDTMPGQGAATHRPQHGNPDIMTDGGKWAQLAQLSIEYDPTTEHFDSEHSEPQWERSSAKPHDIIGHQVNHDGSTGVIGTIGRPERPVRIRGKQRNKDNSLGVIGMVSESAALYLRS